MVRVEYSRKDAEVRHSCRGSAVQASSCPAVPAVDMLRLVKPHNPAADIKAASAGHVNLTLSFAAALLQGKALPGPILTIGDAFAANSLHEEPGVLDI